MKTIKVVMRRSTSSSQISVKTETSHLQSEYSIHYQPKQYPLISNRVSVETKKNAITTLNQMTSRKGLVNNNLENETSFNKAAASQIGLSSFLETRLISPIVLKQKMVDALNRFEKQRESSQYQDQELLLE